MIAAHMRHWIEAMLNPFIISLLLLAVSIVWLWTRGDGRIVRVCLILSFVNLLLFSTGWLPNLLIDKLESQYAAVIKVDPNIHWVVVFGGGHFEDQIGAPANEELSPASIGRLVEGVRLYRQIPDATLVLSGGVGTVGTVSEASYLATVASWFDIPKKDIVLETESINTADEAYAIKKIVHKNPFYLVTSAIHMPRAMALCRRQGLHPVAAPMGHTIYPSEKSQWGKTSFPHHGNLVRVSAAWHEILGIAWGKLRGLL